MFYFCSDIIDRCFFALFFFIMKKKLTPLDNHANVLNSNEGTSGVNEQFAKDLLNRRKQFEANRKKVKEGK